LGEREIHLLLEVGMRVRVIAIIVWSCCALALAPTATHAALDLGTWQTPTVLPSTRAQAVAVTDPLTGDIYVAGGYATLINQGSGEVSPSLATMDVYHPLTNTWNSRANMPVPVRGSSAAYAAGKIYLFGGFPSTTQVQIYTIASNSWVSLALPAGTWESSVVAMPDGTFIVTGGQPNGQHFRYNPATNTTTFLAPLAQENHSLETALIAGKIIAAGGMVNTLTAVADVDAYDPVSNTWSATPANLSSPRSHMAAGAFADQMLLAGGTTNYVNGNPPFLSNFDVYDPVANAWTAGPSLPQGRREAAGAVSGNTFYVFGGLGSAAVSNSVYAISIPEPAAGVFLLSAATFLRRRRHARVL
jgi:N-acetylneuraminic acid mutarotase